MGKETRFLKTPSFSDIVNRDIASLNHSHRQICRGRAPVPAPDQWQPQQWGQPDRRNRIGATTGGLPLPYSAFQVYEVQWFSPP